MEGGGGAGLVKGEQRDGERRHVVGWEGKGCRTKGRAGEARGGVGSMEMGYRDRHELRAWNKG